MMITDTFDPRQPFFSFSLERKRNVNVILTFQHTYDTIQLNCLKGQIKK